MIYWIISVQIDKLDSEFLNYLVANHVNPGDRLPALSEIGDGMGVSVGKLREQLAVARGMGIVSVKPRLGIQREPFNFAESVLPAVIFISSFRVIRATSRPSIRSWREWPGHARTNCTRDPAVRVKRLTIWLCRYCCTAMPHLPVRAS